jgi:pyridoxamine 5'-phosphate oxidase
MTLPKDKNPFDLFGLWFAEAGAQEAFDHTAMALATVDADGMPNVRMVLLKGWDEDGFVFYTNQESHKGQDLMATPKAALCFHWKKLARQVRIRGDVVAVPDAEADAYYASRDRGSRIGAWASKQSRPLESRFALEKEVAKYAAKFGVGAIDRPDHWVGYRIVPNSIEFWQHRDHRLHDRVIYARENAASNSWQSDWLYP